MSDRVFKHVFAWHSLSDACPKCQALNGRVWSNQNMYQNTLWDPFYGDVWDFHANHTLAHPNCRCQLEVRLELADASYVKELLRELLASLEGIERSLEERGALG